MVNAAGDETMMLVHARQVLTTPIASGLQVCGDCTRTLIERIVCLEKPGQSSKVIKQRTLWFHTQSHAVEEQFGDTICEIA